MQVYKATASVAENERVELLAGVGVPGGVDAGAGGLAGRDSSGEIPAAMSFGREAEQRDGGEPPGHAPASGSRRAWRSASACRASDLQDGPRAPARARGEATDNGVDLFDECHEDNNTVELDEAACLG